jgi:acyl phosphate:glycerol-3-phosphate acyltransferase
MVLWLAYGVVALVAAYLLGSIPTGYWIGRILKGIDIREHGSKSIGATNVLRTLGKGPALGVLTVDVLKGMAAIALTRLIYSLPAVVASSPPHLDPATWIPWAVTIAGLVAMMGHSRSIWINFAGGKSVATGLGVLLAMSWQVGLGALLVFGATLAIWRIVSLGSIAAAIAAPALMLLLNQPLPYLLLAIAGGLYIILRHRANIQRLLAGTEPPIGQKHQEPERKIAQQRRDLRQRHTLVKELPQTPEFLNNLAETIVSWGNSGRVAYIPQTIQYTRHSNNLIRGSVASALGQLASQGSGHSYLDKVIPVLHQLSRDPDPLVRRTAVEALAKIPSERVIPAIELALRDSDGRVVRAASVAIAKFKFYPVNHQAKSGKILPKQG